MEKVSTRRGVTVVELVPHYDTLDDDSTRRLEKLLHGLVDSAERPLVVVDMAQTTSIGSTFVGVLFSTEKRLRRRQGHLAICNANTFCAEVLRVVKSESVIKSYPTREEAIDGLTTALSAPS